MSQETGTVQMFVPLLPVSQSLERVPAQAQECGTHRICYVQVPPPLKGGVSGPRKSLPLPVALPTPSAHQDPLGTSSCHLSRSSADCLSPKPRWLSHDPVRPQAHWLSNLGKISRLSVTRFLDLCRANQWARHGGRHL